MSMKLMQKFSIFAGAGTLLSALAGCGPSATPAKPPAPPAVIVSPAHPVPSNGGNTAARAMPVPANAQRVTIKLPDGYKKGAATVKAGVPVALTFKLTSEAGCGDEVVVPAAHWRKKLKVGQSATVVYTPKQSGELKFACSMDMYKGSVVVK
jgi:hypothetical protein